MESDDFQITYGILYICKAGCKLVVNVFVWHKAVTFLAPIVDDVLLGLFNEPLSILQMFNGTVNFVLHFTCYDTVHDDVVLMVKLCGHRCVQAPMALGLEFVQFVYFPFMDKDAVEIISADEFIHKSAEVRIELLECTFYHVHPVFHLMKDG